MEEKKVIQLSLISGFHFFFSNRIGLITLQKNLPKNVHSRSLDAEPPVKVAEVVEELLQVLRVVDLPHYLLYHTQNVHPMPVQILVGFQLKHRYVGHLAEDGFDFLVVGHHVNEEVDSNPGDMFLKHGPGSFKDGHVRSGEVQVVHVSRQLGILSDIAAQALVHVWVPLRRPEGGCLCEVSGCTGTLGLAHPCPPPSLAQPATTTSLLKLSGGDFSSPPKLSHS